MSDNSRGQASEASLVREARQRVRTGDYAKTTDDVWAADDILDLCDAIESLLAEREEMRRAFALACGVIFYLRERMEQDYPVEIEEDTRMVRHLQDELLGEGGR